MNQKKKIKEMIDDTRVGMFSTQDNGSIFSRPIAIADVDLDNNVWFFTDINSSKVDDIINNKNVNFSFNNESENEYVSLSGKAEIIQNATLIEEKWSYLMKVWFPKGKESERLTLIKVTPQSVQYWDGTSSKIIQLYSMAKALITGKSYDEVTRTDNSILNY